MPKPTGAQILGALLRAASRGASTYYDQKQLAEQEELRKKDREWVETVRGWRKEDRQRDITTAKREQQVQQQAQAMLKFLGGNTIIPNAFTMMQRATETLGRTAPEDVKFGAKREGLIRAGLTQEQVLKKLGIAPKAPKAPKEPSDLDNYVQLSLNPKRTPAQEIRFQALDKRFRKDDKAQAEADKQRKKIKTDQKKWDKDVRAHVLRNAEAYPQTAELLNETGRFSIGYRLKPESWSDKNWNLYKFEQVKINRFMGKRPVVTESDVDPGAMEKLRSKYSEEEIQQALQ